MIPGEYILRSEQITLNEGRDAISIQVINTGDRPVQVGSHFHFFEVNKQLSFDRAMAYGRRLDIPSGTAVRFEPGESKDVSLVEIGGTGIVYGFSNLVDGKLLDEKRAEALQHATGKGFKHIPQ